MNAFLIEFQHESDRAAAVLGPALLDGLLKQLLASSVVSSKKSRELLNTNRSLGSFGASVTAAVAQGVISTAEASDLDRLRKVRNTFAHQLHGLTFTDHGVADLCGQLACAQHAIAANRTFASDYPQSPRATFNLATALLAHYLRNRAKGIAPSEEAARPW
jgi:DNA-binding MltR family transcriptional regulator